MKHKFVYSDLDDEEILMGNFNSNFECSCLTNNIPPIKDDVFYKFNISNNDSFDKSFNFGPNDTNKLDDTYDLLPSFKYYQTHELHKLFRKTNNSAFSLLHTNICYLKANFENLEILLSNIEHKFDIIVLTEAWNSEEKKSCFSPGHLEGYQNYNGITGITIKSGCGFYINESLKFIQRKDLDISLHDENNEFQFK